MRELLSEAERHPTRMPASDLQIDMDMKNTLEPAEFYAETTDFPCTSDDAMSWKTKNNPFGGYSQ
jgi:hypothetical protein